MKQNVFHNLSFPSCLNFLTSSSLPPPPPIYKEHQLHHNLLSRTPSTCPLPPHSSHIHPDSPLPFHFPIHFLPITERSRNHPSPFPSSSPPSVQVAACDLQRHTHARTLTHTKEVTVYVCVCTAKYCVVVYVHLSVFFFILGNQIFYVANITKLCFFFIEFHPSEA